MIYFIQIDAPPGHIKIGHTDKEPIERLRALQTASPFELLLLAVQDGDMATESELHQRFASCRVRGEWFSTSPELLRYIANLKDRSGSHDPALLRLSLQGTDHPVWQRQVFVRESPWEVYAPAAASGNEQLALFAATHDGVAIVFDLEHPYLPVQWLRSHYPERSELWDLIEANARRGVDQSKSIPRLDRTRTINLDTLARFGAWMISDHAQADYEWVLDQLWGLLEQCSHRLEFDGEHIHGEGKSSAEARRLREFLDTGDKE